MDSPRIISSLIWSFVFHSGLISVTLNPVLSANSSNSFSRSFVISSSSLNT